jgi:hypothetical protein
LEAGKLGSQKAGCAEAPELSSIQAFQPSSYFADTRNLTPEIESAAFTTLAASSFSMRSCVIVNIEPVMLMDATPDPTYVASDNPLGVSSLSICMKINAKLKFRPKNIS